MRRAIRKHMQYTGISDPVRAKKDYRKAKRNLRGYEWEQGAAQRRENLREFEEQYRQYQWELNEQYRIWEEEKQEERIWEREHLWNGYDSYY